MTTVHGSTLPAKSVQFCAVTGDFEVRVNDQIIGYAATELRATQLANEYVYAALGARGHAVAALDQDDADALLALHLAEPSDPLDLAPAPDLDAATVLLPLAHPIWRLLPETAWLMTQLPFAA